MRPLYRHGDVLVQDVVRLPGGALDRPGLVLVSGECTGHCHRIAENDGRARLYTQGGQLFLVLTAPGSLVHEEHATIALPAGTYRVWQQREYVPPRPDAPAGFRPVAD